MSKIVVAITTIVSVLSLVWIGWCLAAIHACEAHDHCEHAPDWARNGLHDLQGMDGGCVYRPEGCDGKMVPW